MSLIKIVVRLGLEPRLVGSEPTVLPLDDLTMCLYFTSTRVQILLLDSFLFSLVY